MAQKTPNILKRIVTRKREEIDESINRIPIERMIELTKFADKTRGFYDAPVSYTHLTLPTKA